MYLSQTEKKFYSGVYSKLEQNGQPLDQANCKKLIERGVDDPHLCNKIWEFVSGGQENKILEKEELFRMLKYIAAHQQGYNIEKTPLESLKELPKPNLPKKSVKESTKLPTESSVTKSTSAAETNGQREVAEGNIVGKENKAYNNSTTSHDLMNTMESGKSSGTQMKITNEDRKKEDKKTVEKKEAPPTSKMIEKESKLLEELDADLGRPEKSKSKGVLDFEEKKTNEKKPKVAEELESDHLRLEKKKSKEMPNDEGTKVVEKKTRVYKDTPTELITPAQIKPVEIPSFEESIRLSNPNVLVNPFKPKVDDKLEEKQGNKIKLKIASIPENVKDLMSSEIKKENGEIVPQSGLTSNPISKKKSGSSKPKYVPSFMSYSDYLEKKEKIKIEIVYTTTHNNGFLGYASYVTYFIKSKYLNGKTFEVERRYSDFDWLNSFLHSQTKYKGFIFPRLPEKKSIGTTDQNFIYQRKIELERYLREIARHEVLSQDNVLRVFLGDEEGESFQSIKEKNVTPTFSSNLAETDLHHLKGAFEYVIASTKTKFRKGEITFVMIDWKDANDKINEVLALDESILKIINNLQRKEDSFKVMQSISSKLNIIHTKIMNRVEDESYYSLGMLSSHLAVEATKSFEACSIVENLNKEAKTFRSKVDSFKESRYLLITTLQEVETTRELLRNKQEKVAESQGQNNGNGFIQIQKDADDVEKKLRDLQKEAETIRDNLIYEMDNLFKEFEMFLPIVLNEFYSRQTEHIEKVSPFTYYFFNYDKTLESCTQVVSHYDS